MQVVVWKSYGDIEVYEAETCEQLIGIIEIMMKCVENWGMDETIALVRTHIEKHPTDIKEIRRAFQTIKNQVEHDNDDFEKIELVETKDVTK